MVFWLNPQVFKYRVRPESLHMVLHLLFNAHLFIREMNLPSSQSDRDG
jgi:hypothetical protein